MEQSPSLDPEQVLERKEVQAYGEAVSKLFDEEENEELLQEYKQSVLNLMFAKDELPAGGKNEQKDDLSPGVEGNVVDAK